MTLSAPLLHRSALRTRGFAYYGPVFSYSVFLVVSLDPFDIFSVKETGNEKELLPVFIFINYVLRVSIGCMMTAKEFCTLVITSLRVRISTTSCRVEIAQFGLVAS